MPFLCAVRNGFTGYDRIEYIDILEYGFGIDDGTKVLCDRSTVDIGILRGNENDALHCGLMPKQLIVLVHHSYLFNSNDAGPWVTSSRKYSGSQFRSPSLPLLV